MKIQTAKMSQYIQQIIPQIKEADFPLSKIDLKPLEGIQSDIPIFQNNSLEEIKFLTKWFQVLNLTRGCKEQCTFCLRNALLPLRENAQRINTIIWEDLTRITGGFSKLSERLGVNILNGNSHITLFEDSNLPDIKIKDTNGCSHRICEAVQNIHKNLGLPIVFATSGWNPADKFSQQSAEELCQYIEQNPDSAKEFAVSINPFHRYNRAFYTDKMANTLKTFLPLYKNGIASILIKYNYPEGIDSDKNDYNAAKSLYIEIFEKLKLLTGSSLEEYEALKPENVTLHREDNLIENKGRGRNFFTKEVEEKNRKKLFVESFEWLTMTPAERKDYAYNHTTKNIDINGDIYLITPSEQYIPTTIQLNFINKNKITAPIHSDIKFQELKF